MKPLTIILLVVAAYLVYRWHRRRQLAGLLRAAAPAAVGGFAPSAMTTPTTPANTNTQTNPAPSVTVAAEPSADLYWRLPSSYIAL